jgi:hypothetical protein
MSNAPAPITRQAVLRIAIAAVAFAPIGCTDADPPFVKPSDTPQDRMTPHDPQIIWSEYYQRICARRISESQQLLAAMREDGVTDESILFLDFRHFSSEKASAENLGGQLAENYEIKITHDADTNYWFVDGATRPDGVAISMCKGNEWVSFMADVAQSHGCVFSTWCLTDGQNDRSWSNELFQFDPE